MCGRVCGWKFFSVTCVHYYSLTSLTTNVVVVTVATIAHTAHKHTHTHCCCWTEAFYIMHLLCERARAYSTVWCVLLKCHQVNTKIFNEIQQQQKKSLKRILLNCARIFELCICILLIYIWVYKIYLNLPLCVVNGK